MTARGTILVAGATGTVGRHVVHGLLAAGETVRALSRDAARAHAVLGDTVDVVIGDLDDPATLAAALDGTDRLFLASPNHPAQLARERAAIDAAARARVRRVVKLSALGAEPGSPLDFWDVHGRLEGHLQESGVPAVVLQPTTFMGMVLASADSIRHAGAIFAPLGDAKIAFTDPRDVAAVAVQALLHEELDGHTLAVTGPELLTLQQVAETVSEVVGRPVSYVPVTDDAASRVADRLGPAAVARREPRHALRPAPRRGGRGHHRHRPPRDGLAAAHARCLPARPRAGLRARLTP